MLVLKLHLCCENFQKKKAKENPENSYCSFHSKKLYKCYTE